MKIPPELIRVHVTVDGTTVAGHVVSLYPNDITIEIDEPFSGFRSSLHVPAFAMYEMNRLASMDGGRLTERGRSRAECLLRCLYDYGRGKPIYWGVEELTATGWTRVEPTEAK
jgi:hypothetical protein